MNLSTFYSGVIGISKFDKEYSTQYSDEMKYLKQNEIYYTFVKIINGITVYKYEKTEELFVALAKFYSKDKVIERKR